MTRSLVLSFLLSLLIASHAAAQQWAQKMFKTCRHDFGAVARGSKAEYAFEFENIYEEDVHVASVRSSCGCTTPTVTKSTLKTWEKSSVLVSYNTRSFLGEKGATVTVVFDRPYYAEVQLIVTGHIRGDVVFDPGELDFGEVASAQPAEKTVKVSYAGRSTWHIVDVRSANEHVEVELTETQRSGGRVAYDMLVRLKPDFPPGFFQDQLTIVTDDQKRQTIPLTIRGNVASLLTVSPASLFLGSLEPGETVTKQLFVKGQQPFKVVNIKCGDKAFEFKAPPDEKKTLHVISVTYKAGPASGRVSETIEIETDLGEGAKATCLATGSVKEPASAQ